MAVRGRMSKELKAFFWALPAGIAMAGCVYLLPRGWFLPVAALPMMPAGVAEDTLLLTAMLSCLTGILGFTGIFCARIFAVRQDEMARFCADHPVYRNRDGDGPVETGIPPVVHADPPNRRPMMVNAEFAAIAMGAANDVGREMDARDLAGQHPDEPGGGDAAGSQEMILTADYGIVEEDGPDGPSDGLDENIPDAEPLSGTGRPGVRAEDLDMLVAQMEASAEQRREQLAALEIVAAKITSGKEDGAGRTPDAMPYRPLSAVPQEEAASPDKDMDMMLDDRVFDNGLDNALDSALEILQKINRRA